MFLFYLKRIIKSPVFWGGIILLTVLMVIGCYEDLGAASRNNIPVLYCLWVTNSIGISHVLVPAVVVIPFLFFFVDELEKGSLYYQLIRSRKTGCYLGQLGASVVSAMLLTILSVICFSLICMLYGAGWQANESLIQGYSGTYYEEMIQSQPWLVYLINVFVFVLYSTPWVLMGMVISLFTKHRYLILIGPLMIFMAMNYLTELAGLPWLGPDQTLLKGLDARNLAGGGIYYALSYHLILDVALSLCYLILSRRKYKHEGV